MKKLTIILVFMAILMSCEKNEIIQDPESTLFIYNSILLSRDEINHKFIENGYTRTNKTIFFNYESQIKGFAMYDSCDTIIQITEKVVYIINRIDYNVFIPELNSKLIIEISDSIWHEPVEYNDTNIWVLKKGVGMYDDKYFLIVE